MSANVKSIDTAKMSVRLRQRAINVANRKLLIHRGTAKNGNPI